MTAITPEQDAKEREDVESLQSLTGGALGPEDARRVLRKYGDLQRAADAFFNGDVVPEQEEPRVEVQTSRTVAPDPANVIDLTQEEEDAAKYYTDQAQKAVQFGPSNREPDPNWQVTLASDKPAENTQRNDASLDHAIQASLADFHNNDDELEIYPMEETLREGQRPIALRPDSSTIVYAALVVQALFAVPQVRQAVAKLELPDVGRPPQEKGPSSIWHLVELFTNLDRAVLSSIVDKDAVPSLEPYPWNGATDSLPRRTTEFLAKLAELIETRLGGQHASGDDDPEDRVSPNLFNFEHTEVECKDNEYIVNLQTERSSYVPVEVGEGSSNNLISKLASTLSKYENGNSRHDVIASPSEVLLFSLERAAKPPGYSSQGYSSAFTTAKSSPKPFSFPKTFYLDRFLKENVALVNEKRQKENEMIAEMEDLTKQRDFILRHNGRDTMADLRNTLYYYEHVAQSSGDPEREANLKKTKQSLQGIIDLIINGAQRIDQRVEELQADVLKVFDCPELQHHRYDLRAVLMHTGLPGRKQVYSYVQDNHGTWWKSLDCTVTEVSEETVLTDPTGIHLAAGPYLLIYSRCVSDEEINAPIPWPKIFVDTVDSSNQTFLSHLPPELASKVTSRKPSGEGERASSTTTSRTSSTKSR